MCRGARGGGEPLDFYDAACEMIRMHRRRKGEQSRLRALADFRDLLASEGFVRLQRKDEGMARCWRVVRDSASERSG